jgi:transposase InsO family protein
LDHGPIRVHEKMRSLGLDPVPAVSSLARIFRDAGVARAEPRKKPRASYRRFVYPAPNACWQLDATEYVLTGGRKCVIFQLIDDHSRLAVASHVSRGETSEGAIAVVSKGIAAHGVPQRLLSDNGAALNPSRRGVLGQLVAYLRSLGVEPITGKPDKPTTQGKNERFHQTLFRYLQQGAGYGTPAERMNPAIAAAAFYTRMQHVPDWQTLAPTLVAHAVQISADPNHYAGFRTPAEQVLAVLTGASAGAFQAPADARVAAGVLVGAIHAKKPMRNQDSLPSKCCRSAARRSTWAGGRGPKRMDRLATFCPPSVATSRSRSRLRAE